MTSLAPVSAVARVIAVVVVLGGLVAACGDDSGPDAFTAAVHDGVLEGCAEDDSDDDVVEVCECTYDTLTDDLSFEEFARIENRLAQGEERLPDQLVDAIRDCIRGVSAERATPSTVSRRDGPRR